jgi:hypothetical protein
LQRLRAEVERLREERDAARQLAQQLREFLDQRDRIMALLNLGRNAFDDADDDAAPNAAQP